MKMSLFTSVGKWIIIAVAAAVLITPIIAVIAPSTEDFNVHNRGWNGLSKLMEEFNATIVGVEGVDRAPGRVILIVSPQVIEGLVGKLRKALEGGATVLILEDFDEGGFRVARELGVRVEAYPGPLLDPVFYYKDYFMPRVKMGNITGYFNYGTALSSYEGSCIAWSSHMSFIDLNLNGIPDPGEPSGEFCVAVEARVGRGRLVVVADSSVAINSMVEVNRDFIKGLVGKEGLTLVSGLRFESLHSRFRGSVLGLLDLTFKPPIVYIVALSSIPFIALAGRLLVTVRAGGVRDDVRFIISRHPGWSVEKLRRLWGDLYGR